MSRRQTTGLAMAAAGLALAGCPAKTALPPDDVPKLTVLIVVDQLGADHLVRFDEAFEGGFRRLLDEGVSFTEAHHAHAKTLTAPGHATIATGCHPSEHGIVSNYWTDPATSEEVYSVEDDLHERSPYRLECSALGGWLKDRYPASRVYSLSLKDRSAILMGGLRADGAYWYDWAGSFTSSSYYRESEPAWLETLNITDSLASHFGKVWEPEPFDLEALAAMGVQPFDLGPLEEDFPHVIGGAAMAPGDSFFDDVYLSPWMNDGLLEVVRTVISTEGLGQGDYPDLVAIGFSNIDGAGHEYGPDSREFFDLLVRLDRQLGDFFEWLDGTVGLENVAIALTSDHGSVPVPELRLENGLPAKRLGADEIACFQQVEAALDTEFGEAQWLRPGPFFAPAPAGREELASKVRQRTRELLEVCPSVSRVWLAEELEAEGADEMQQRYARSYFSGRSPDLLVQWDEYFLVSARSASSHGTPHRYDTHVPMIFWRAEMTPARNPSPVRTVDVAPTLAAWLGIEPPPGIGGRSLSLSGTPSVPAP